MTEYKIVGNNILTCRPELHTSLAVQDQHCRGSWDTQRSQHCPSCKRWTEESNPPWFSRLCLACPQVLCVPICTDIYKRVCWKLMMQIQKTIPRKRWVKYWRNWEEIIVGQGTSGKNTRLYMQCIFCIKGVLSGAMGYYTPGISCIQGCTVYLDVNISSDNLDGWGVESTSQRR